MFLDVSEKQGKNLSLASLYRVKWEKGAGVNKLFNTKLTYNVD
jgi:hypothetical protein